MQNELEHHGIKGMKWGVRRYRNTDGSLTNTGKKRYARDAREKGYNKYDSSTGTYYKKTKKGSATLEADPNRYSKEDLERTKKFVDSTSNMANQLKRANTDFGKRQHKNTLDLSKMTDQELRERINRANLEKQYNDLFAPQEVSNGREYVDDVLDRAGTVLGVTGSALGIALAIKELRG